MAKQSFFAELMKRKVVQVAAIYGAVAWGLTEGVVTIVEQLFLPQWVSTLAVVGFVVGFPIAMFLAWTFDITPEGIRRTEITSRRGKTSIALSMLLLVAGTAGLFLLIKPSMDGLDQDIDPHSVAVLPFENVGNDDQQDYLSQGLSDDLRDQLGRSAGLRIAARSSSVVAAGLNADAKKVAERLGVAMLVEGSLRPQGGRFRVSVQLIEGRTGLSIWTKTYVRGSSELLTVQQEIAREIGERAGPEGAISVAEPATAIATASELMWQARYFERQVRAQPEVDRETLQKAIQLYRQATIADPSSALAHSRLADALMYYGDFDAAEAAATQAMVLNPKLSEVQHTMGLYYFARGLPDARASFRRALEINPNNADALSTYAQILWLEGITDGVEDMYRRALQQDLLSLTRYAALGDFLGKTAQPEKTLALTRVVEQLVDTTDDDIVNPADAYRVIEWLLELTGRVDEAIAWTIRARDLEPDNESHVERLAELYAEIGDFETVLALDPEPNIGVLFKMRRYDELIEEAEEFMIDQPEDLGVRVLLAFAHTASNRPEDALWILSTTGVPESIMTMPRSSLEWQAYFILMNALLTAGQVESAKGLADYYYYDPTHPVDDDWIVNSWMACCVAVLGQDANALDWIEGLPKSPRLPWSPMLMDLPCFEKYADEPVYQAMIQHFEERRAQLRKMLPATLAEFGVAL